MSGIIHDLRYALRGLRKNPGFTTVALLTLSLGIGVNTAMFSVLNATILRPLPYPNPDALAMLWTERPAQGLREGRSAYRDIEQWRTQSQRIADLAIFDPATVRLTAPGELERISVVRASPNFFEMLGAQPLRGRIFTKTEADERRRVAIISYRLAQSRFGGIEHALGATIGLDDVPSEIVGIMPPGFPFAGESADVWEPHTMFPDWNARRSDPNASSWFVLGRLRPQATFEQAQAELNAIAARLDEERPASEAARGITIAPLSLHVIGPRARLTLWLLSGAVLCVLLIGVANIASLSLARGASRDREVALRTALGASRLRIVRQLLIESLVLAGLSAFAGLLVAWAGLPLIMALEPSGLTLAAGRGLDARTLAWALGLAMFSGALVGLAPAMTSGRLDLASALHGGSKGTATGGAKRLTRHALVVAEFAMAIVLLVGAGLLTRSLLRVQDTSPGFNPGKVVSMQLALPDARTSQQRTAYYQAVVDAVEAVGGVESAGVIGDLFISGAQEQVVTVEGGARPISERLPLRRDETSSRVFETIGAPLVRGRSFSVEDGPNAPLVAIVNDTMARRLWPQGDAVGKRFKFGPPAAETPWFTVVGIAGDMRRQSREHDPVPQMFEPLAQNPSRLATLLVRTTNDPSAMMATLQAAVRGVDPRVPVYGVTTLEARLEGFEAQRRFQTSLFGAFSLVALALAAVGIYGVVHYSTAMRTREIGVRMAVGAQRGDIFRMIVGEGLKLSFSGLALGLVGALWLGHIGSSLLFGVSSTDPLTYIAVSLLLTAVALAGCYFPARRAARVDPLVALRWE